MRMCHYISNAIRRNLVSAHVPSHFKLNQTKSGFCACAITFQTQSTVFSYVKDTQKITGDLKATATQFAEFQEIQIPGKLTTYSSQESFYKVVWFLLFPSL
jgi:hypothetical protein